MKGKITDVQDSNLPCFFFNVSETWTPLPLNYVNLNSLVTSNVAQYLFFITTGAENPVSYILFANDMATYFHSFIT